jgi:hypothetical protein
MFIFDDLVIVAAALSEKSGLFSNKKKGPKSALRVLSESEGGIGKVLEVKDWSGWQGKYSYDQPTMILTSRPYLFIRIDDRPNVLYGPISTRQSRNHRIHPSSRITSEGINISTNLPDINNYTSLYVHLGPGDHCGKWQYTVGLQD